MHRRTTSVGVVLAAALMVAGCATERNGGPKRIWPEYDKDGKLQLLKYDSKGSGKVDTWSYMDGTRVVRIEADTDQDGRIDRWEYYRPDRQLEKVGTSRTNDGHPDSWSFPGTDGTVARIEVSTRPDGKVTRVEHYEHAAMVRAEEDTDSNGATDKWETYDGARLASVAFDTTHRGFPDRRLTYEAGGTVTLDIDPDGDGHLAPPPTADTAARRATPR